MRVLTGAAKYDVACTSSGSSRAGVNGKLGNAVYGGICHSFAADGRCISLLKILMTNHCVFDCKYCANRSSNDLPRATLDPDELAGLTIAFYRRNYIEGLFLSSGVLKSPDYTMERMIRAIEILRNKYNFNGYIHAKSIPGASEALISILGSIVDRISVNIELPSEKSLKILAPDKDRESVVRPMSYIKNRISQTKNELTLFRNAPKFAPAGHATQMIIGATPDSDFQIVRLAESLYERFRLKRVFYSAYVPAGSHELLPVGQPPPLLREHRLYQTDWLLRFYGFKSSEILDSDGQNLSLEVDPKCHWALNHMDYFPVEVNKAEYEELLRVPGIGQVSARRIVAARRTAVLDYAALKKLGVTLKRAVFFITCSGKPMYGLTPDEATIRQFLTAGARRDTHRYGGVITPRQLSFIDDIKMIAGGVSPGDQKLLLPEAATAAELAILSDATAAIDAANSVNGGMEGWSAAGAAPGGGMGGWSSAPGAPATALLPSRDDILMAATGNM